MNHYDFPIIKTIDDVIYDIHGYDEIRIIEKDDYTVINYAVAFEDTFEWDEDDKFSSSIRRECRGLIFDSKGKLISRPYHKFFNLGEKEDTQINQINLHEPHVILEKLDGSMVRPIPTLEGFRLATKAGITDVSMNAEEFISDKQQYSKFIFNCFKSNVTPIFEWVSRKNRIVVDYSEDNLILTAIRNTIIGNYFSYWNIRELAKYYGIPIVNAIDGFSTKNIDSCVNQIRQWDDGEGVVIRFNTGHMVKIKTDDYVLRHKSKEAIHQEKNVIQTVLEDAVDDLVPLLSLSDADRIRRFQRSFWMAVDDLAGEMADLYNVGNIMYPDKKDFAVEFVQRKILPIHAPIMYAMRGGKGSKEAIIEMIGKNISTQTKIDENRWLFGNLNWNYES